MKRRSLVGLLLVVVLTLCVFAAPSAPAFAEGTPGDLPDVDITSWEFLLANCREEDVQRLLDQGALIKTGRRYRIPEDHFFVSDEIIRELV